MGDGLIERYNANGRAVLGATASRQRSPGRREDDRAALVWWHRRKPMLFSEPTEQEAVPEAKIFGDFTATFLLKRDSGTVKTGRCY